jgi:glycerol dehydrogenase-like iron-containing ADH family enzyme
MKNFHRVSGEISNKEELVFPGKVIKGEGTVDNIDAGPYKAPFLFSGPFVMKTFGKDLLKNNPGIRTITFSGEVWPGELYRVKKALADARADCLFAMGGGKAMDLAKLVKNDLPDMKLVNIPTSAATCAAMTPVSVMYDREGAYSDTIDSAVPDEVVMDYRIFYRLPIGFFAAGAADAISKYYETLAARRVLKKELNALDDAAFSIAEASKDKLKDIIYLKWDRVAEAERRELADINIIMSGMASCTGRYSVMGLFAHGMAHAATHMEKAGEFLHGEHVSAGLVIQEGMLNNKKNIAEIKSMFEIMDVPMGLSAIGVKKDDLKQLYAAFEKIDNREKISVYAPGKLLYNKLQAYL